MSEFIYMCNDYFQISLKDFFDEGCQDPLMVASLKANIEKLNEQDKALLLAIAQRMTEKSTK
ncbi:MAG: hypothetical protein U0M23_03640 [Acutalibacteraceae bacterium]|nr:hypothetical protein [Acutalibacteraceae bacterium]